MASDFHRVEFGTQSAAKAGPRHSAGPSPASPPVAPTAAPPDSVLVPIDQWNRLLGQLGNIHEAGQQLAEARERMGRAETENDFLKERIRDLRAQLERRDEIPAVPMVTPGPEPPEIPPRHAKTLSFELTIPEWLLRRRKRNP
jgi:hypothetical protein